MQRIILAALVLLVPLASAASTTLPDTEPDAYTGHYGVESLTVTSDGTDVSYVLTIDAFDVNQPRTEYYLNLETEDYRSIWFECYVEGTGSGYTTSCDASASENPVDSDVWDTYYGLGVPVLAAHRLAPYVQTSAWSPTVVFDASAGTIGATMPYTDPGFTSGQRVLVTIFGADDGVNSDRSNAQTWVTLA